MQQVHTVRYYSAVDGKRLGGRFVDLTTNRFAEKLENMLALTFKRYKGDITLIKVAMGDSDNGKTVESVVLKTLTTTEAVAERALDLQVLHPGLGPNYFDPHDERDAV